MDNNHIAIIMIARMAEKSQVCKKHCHIAEPEAVCRIKKPPGLRHLRVVCGLRDATTQDAQLHCIACDIACDVACDAMEFFRVSVQAPKRRIHL